MWLTWVGLGAMYGRSGKGSIYVFPVGNGGKWADNCNYDGYTNSPFTITGHVASTFPPPSLTSLSSSSGSGHCEWAIC
jgi:hypothetical protein